MYSHVGIIIGAVVSALLGFYVFVPDGSLRMFDYWLSMWQPILWDAPVVVHSPSFEEELAQYLLPPPFQQDELIDVAQSRYVNDEEIIEKLQVPSDILSPVIGPRIPPQVDHDLFHLLLHFLWVVTGVVLSLWPYFIFCLAIIASVQKTWDLRNLQKRHHEEKEDISEQLREKIKENLKMAKSFEEQARKILVLEDKTKILGDSYKNLEAEHFKVNSGKNDLETQLRSLKHNAKELDANHNATQAQLEKENKKLEKDKQNQQGQLEEKSEQVKQLEEDKKIQQNQLQEKNKLVKQLEANAEEKAMEALDKEKQRKKAEEELKILQPIFEGLKIANKHLEESVEESEGKKKEQAQQMIELKGQLSSFQGESSKIKSAKKGLEQELNFLLDEAKQRHAELKQLQARTEKMEKERDAALEEVHALNLKPEGTARPHLGTAKEADEASEDGAGEIEEDVDPPKKAGKKKRRRRRARAPEGEKGRKKQEEKEEMEVGQEETHEKK